MFADQLPPWVNTTSARVGAGLGTIARVVASGETIYRGKLPFAEAERRVRTCWQPFHETLEALIAETRAAFGACLLIDCHSMPAHGTGRAGAQAGRFRARRRPRHRLRADVTRLVEQLLIGLRAIAVRRNDPYAGGYITRHYGRPREGVHALQIEIARDLYMDEARFERLPRLPAVQQRSDALDRGLWPATVRRSLGQTEPGPVGPRRTKKWRRLWHRQV